MHQGSNMKPNEKPTRKQGETYRWNKAKKLSHFLATGVCKMVILILSCMLCWVWYLLALWVFNDDPTHRKKGGYPRHHRQSIFSDIIYRSINQYFLYTTSPVLPGLRHDLAHQMCLDLLNHKSEQTVLHDTWGHNTQIKPLCQSVRESPRNCAGFMLSIWEPTGLQTW